MIIFDYKENVIKFIFCVIILLFVILIVNKLFYKETVVLEYNEVTTSKIEYNDDITSIYVEYPRFNNNYDVNELVSNNIYKYVKEFKESPENKLLDITYKVSYVDSYANIEYKIENSLSKVKYKNLIINLDNNKIAYISSIYDEDKLRNEILNLVETNYSSDIYEKVKKETINNFTYLIEDERVEVYFNNIDYEEYEYIPFVTISLSINTIDNVDDGSKKYIAFTYDDGPSEYTEKILDLLEKNNFSATFFMVGNKMKVNEEVVKKIYESNSEIGSHGYSHKLLNDLSIEDYEDEINSFNIIYNELTLDHTSLFRPPYGKYNDYIYNYYYNVILWDIDPKDWLFRNEDTTYNNVIKNACDGCIVILHDTNETTLKASEKLFTQLKNMNYEVVSVSKLIEIKGIDNIRAIK